MTAAVDHLIAQFLQSVEEIINDHAHARIRTALGRAFGTVDPSGPSRAGRPPGRRAGGAGRAPGRVSRARRLQGQYLGALRGLKGRARARVKKLAQQKGVAEAVKLAARLST